MKKTMMAVVLCCTVISLAAASGQGGKPAGGQIKIGISKITSHPALDACEQGIQDRITARGIDAVFDLQSANGDPSTAA
ncbi:MAG: ABC transporter substrate-binding protein, partial [Spirochaetaceae bacterium]|nr:ABC transporter substrate-binding protein [Spirochaetaceae bacterium]